MIIAGYEVPHAHIHLVPTNEMSELSFANAAASVERDDLEVVGDGDQNSAVDGGLSGSISAISSGRLFRTLFTSVDTGCISSEWSALMSNSVDRESTSSFVGSSHSAQRDLRDEHGHSVVDRRHGGVGARW